MQALSNALASVNSVENLKKTLSRLLETFQKASKVKKGMWLFFAVYVLYQTARQRGWLPKKSIKDDVVVITGGGQGIGRLVALLLARRGAKVAILDINQETANKVQKEITDKGGKAVALKCDVCSIQQIKEAKAAVNQQLGNITMLINNAGIVVGKYFQELTEKNIELTMRVNAISHFYLIQEVLPDFLQKKRGHLVGISSMAGISGMVKSTDYCASKFACYGLYESLFLELRQNKDTKHIKSTIICPFYINTGMFEGVKTRFSFLLPILDEKWVAQRIVNAILQEEEVVIMPYFGNFISLLKFLFPPSVNGFLFDIIGGNVFMKDFKGHKSSS